MSYSSDITSGAMIELPLDKQETDTHTHTHTHTNAQRQGGDIRVDNDNMLLGGMLDVESGSIGSQPIVRG